LNGKRDIDKLISVIVPTYNVEINKLRNTIESVLRQTYHPIEVIVIDDGSQTPFGSLDTAVFESYVEQNYPHHNIQFILPGKHLGLAGVKNLGIQKSRGEFIAFLDCGDWWDQHKLKKQIAHFRQTASDCGLVYCGAKIVNITTGNAEILYEMYPSAKGSDLCKDFLIYNKITGSNSSVLIKRECFKKVGLFYDKDDIPEDIEMWGRIAKSYTIDYVKECLVYIEKDLNSMSNNPEKKEQTYLRYYKLKEFELKKYGLWNRAMSQYYSVIGKKYILKKKYIKGILFFATAFRYGLYKQTLLKFTGSICEAVFNTYKITKAAHYIRNKIIS